MATQNLTFFNNATGTNMTSQIATLQQDLGYGQSITSTGSAAVNATLWNYAYGTQTNPATFGAGVNDVAHKGAFFYGGNIKSGETVFLTTGTCNANNDAFTLDTLYNPASAGKMVVGMACAKMMEEGLLLDSTKISVYDPTLFSGIAQIYSSVTVTDPANFPFTGSYTATYTTGAIADITIRDLIHFGLGAYTDPFMLPPVGALSVGALFSTGSSSLLANLGSNASTVDKAWLVNLNIYVQSLLTQGTGCIGISTKAFNGLQLTTTSLKTSITEIFDNMRNGTVPLPYRPGARGLFQFPYFARSQYATYDASYIVLSYCMDKIARSNGYTCFADYCRQKFFTPLGMSSTYVTYQDTVPSGHVIAENSWRRSIAAGAIPVDLAGNPFAVTTTGASTWPAYGADAGYTTTAATQFATFFGSSGALGSIAGPVVWDSQYPNDGVSRIFPNIFYYLTGSTGSNSVPLGDAPILCSLRDFGTLIYTLGNEGVGPNGTRVLKTESWKYLTSTKVTSLSGMTSSANFIADTLGVTTPSTSYALGLQKTNRDLINITEFGFSENALFNGGFGGCFYIVDTFTGNWIYYGVPEYNGSTGNLTTPSSNLAALQAGLGITVRAGQIGRSAYNQARTGQFVVSLIQ